MDQRRDGVSGRRGRVRSCRPRLDAGESWNRGHQARRRGHAGAHPVLRCGTHRPEGAALGHRPAGAPARHRPAAHDRPRRLRGGAASRQSHRRRDGPSRDHPCAHRCRPRPGSRDRRRCAAADPAGAQRRERPQRRHRRAVLPGGARTRQGGGLGIDERLAADRRTADRHRRRRGPGCRRARRLGAASFGSRTGSRPRGVRS